MTLTKKTNRPSLRPSPCLDCLLWERYTCPWLGRPEMLRVVHQSGQCDPRRTDPSLVEPGIRHADPAFYRQLFAESIKQALHALILPYTASQSPKGNRKILLSPHQHTREAEAWILRARDARDPHPASYQGMCEFVNVDAGRGREVARRILETRRRLIENQSGRRWSRYVRWSASAGDRPRRGRLTPMDIPGFCARIRPLLHPESLPAEEA